MGRFILYFGILATLCTSCACRMCDTTLYQQSGRQKAIVAVLPVINSVGTTDLAWDLSREFTDEIRKRVYNSSKIYLLRDHGSREMAEKLNAPSPYVLPSQELQKLGASEFVVVTELVDQHESDIEKGTGAVLNVAMRVRVVDLRHDKPKVILQEIMNREQLIARPFMGVDYDQMPWGSEDFHRTPMGIVHTKIVRELVARVENYIEAAR